MYPFHVGKYRFSSAVGEDVVENANVWKGEKTIDILYPERVKNPDMVCYLQVELRI